MLEPVLSRLSGVKRIGEQRWIARCPAHDDRSPSLSLAVRDGTPLIHCFAGCETEDVLAAVGIAWRDILPEDDRHRKPISRVVEIAERRAKAEVYLEVFVTLCRDKEFRAQPQDIQRARQCREYLKNTPITKGW